MLNVYVLYLSQQTPRVFTKVRTDGGQQQRLFLYELEDEVSVHAFYSQLAVFVFGSLKTHKYHLIYNTNF